jgi:ribosome recycling factor
MNREERRKLMKKVPEYRKTVKKASKDAVDKLEEMFKSTWIEDDATINNGELWNEGNNDEDDIYNL